MREQTTAVVNGWKRVNTFTAYPKCSWKWCLLESSENFLFSILNLTCMQTVWTHIRLQLEMFPIQFNIQTTKIDDEDNFIYELHLQSVLWPKIKKK